jgi:PAS domain S-box-containing protein
MAELNDNRVDGRLPLDSLREAETWFQPLIESLEDDALFFLDAEGRVMSWNAGVQRVLGYEKAEFLGLPFERLFGPDDHAAAQRQLDRARAVGRSEEECWYVGKDAREVRVRGALTAIWGAGQLRGYGNFLRHRTAETQAAGERDELLDRERAARAEAERANETKEAFLTAVSHELRTPLNAILGWAHLLSAGGLSQENAGRAIQTIERNARAQAQLIDDLLDISHILAGNLELEVRPLTLSRVVTAAVKSVQQEAEAKHVHLSLSNADDPGPIEGDAARLQRVVVKVLANAIKFTPANGLITVGVGWTDREAELTIGDTGEGMSGETLAHIFDRFYQGGEPRRSRLGLAIARHIIEAHGGTMAAASGGEGKGSTVTIRVPFGRGRRMEADVTAKPEPSEEAYPTALVGRCALIVEDQPDSRELMEAVLARCGVLVCAVDSVLHALEALDTHPVDVIISDIGLEGEDGLTLMRRVRERAPDRRGRVPAIAVSAYSGAADRIRAFEAGYQAHIVKPLNPTEVIAAVTALMPSA